MSCHNTSGILALEACASYIATHCNTLQHTATYCNTLQHTATHHNTHCNALQRTATGCNLDFEASASLEYTATITASFPFYATTRRGPQRS